MTNEADNELIFRDLVNSILGQEEFKMDTCFDASVVEEYLEQNATKKQFERLTDTVEVGRKNIEERGLALYIAINRDDQTKNYVLWPSTTDSDSFKNGLRAYDSTDIDNANELEIDDEEIANLIIDLSDIIAE
jgi:hypothetical protein